MYSILGWFNVAALAILILPYALRLINQHVLKRRADWIKEVNRNLRKVHKPLGLLLIVSGAVHGYLALGGFRLHTGSLLLIAIILTAVLGGAFHRQKKRALLRWHRALMGLTLALLALHLIYPAAVYYLLN